MPLTKIQSLGITDGTIVNADINASAAIDASKLTGLSSDFVLLATTDASSSASISFDGYFSATYKNYKLIVSNVTMNETNCRIALRFRRSNADVTTSDVYTTNAIYSDTYPNTEGDQLARTYAEYLVDSFGTIIGNGWRLDSSSTNTINFECHIPDPLGTNNNKSIQSSWGYLGANGGYWQRGISMVTLTNAQTAISGLSFIGSTGSTGTGGTAVITRGNFKLYGIK